MTQILLSCALFICFLIAIQLPITKFSTVVSSTHLFLSKGSTKILFSYIILFSFAINQSKANVHLEESFRNKTELSKVTLINHEFKDVKVITPVDLAITKTANKNAVDDSGDTIIYQLEVANVGTNTTLATITDILPKGLTLINRSISFSKRNGNPSNFKTNSDIGNHALSDMSINLPPGASGVITYEALIHVKDPQSSLINKATINPPDGFNDQNPNNNASEIEVFIKPRLTNKAIGPICSGDPITITLTSSPSSNHTTYEWTARQGKGDVFNFFKSGQGSVITETFEAKKDLGTVIYTVTPTITTKNGTVIHGNAKQFTVTVMPRSKKIDDLTATTVHAQPVVMIYNKDNSPMGNNTTVTWYADPEGKIKLNPQPEFDTDKDATTLDYKLNLIKQPGVYTYYATEKTPQSCESIPAKYMIIAEGHIALAFKPSIVNSGAKAVLEANLTNHLVAPEGGITITLTKSGSAIAGTNYVDNFNTVFIPANQHSASVTISTIHTNANETLDLNVSGTPMDGYKIESPAVLTIKSHLDNKIITLNFDDNGKVQGGTLATLTASLPPDVKAPQGGITVVITNNSGSDKNSALPSRDFAAKDLPQHIYIKEGASSGLIRIQTIDNSGPGHNPVIRLLTVVGTPSVGTMASTSTILKIDQTNYPIRIDMTLSSGCPSDKDKEITPGCTAYLKVIPQLSGVKKFSLTINLSVNDSRTKAALNKDYDLKGTNSNGERMTQTVTLDFKKNSNGVSIPLFVAKHTNIIGQEKKLLEFEATTSKGDILAAPFIYIVDNTPAKIALDFVRPSVNAGSSSTLIVKLDQSTIPTGTPNITSVKDIKVKLTPSGTALPQTHYSGLPTSIIIPAGKNSVSVPIATVDAKEVNTQRELNVKGDWTKDDGNIITSSAALTILYPIAPKPQIDPRTVLNKTICSGEPVDIALSTMNPHGSLCQWTAKRVEGTVSGFADNEGNAIVDVLENKGRAPGKVIYTVTPVTTMPNGATVIGDPTQITVEVLPISGIIIDNSFTVRDAYSAYSYPENPQADVTYTWYEKDKTTIINSSTGEGAKCLLPIPKPGIYTYYMTQTEPGHCPGGFGKMTLTVTQSITLSFNTPTVDGGSPAKLTARLAHRITAPIGGIEISLKPTTDQSTTAKRGANYIGLIDKITIPYGHNSITVNAFTATNNHIIDGSSRLTLTGTGPSGYEINKPNPTIKILDKTGDDPQSKIITLDFDKRLVKSGEDATLIVSLPKNITSAKPILVTTQKVKGKSTAKQNINYEKYEYSITIPKNTNRVEIPVKTLSEGEKGDIKTLWVCISQIDGKQPKFGTSETHLNIQNPKKIYIPNVFSPNDDGRDDFWIITGIDRYPKCRVTVYNRWGKEVFYSDPGYTQPWDGKQNHQPLPVATYYYVIDLKDGSKPISGYVAIVR